MPNIKMGRIALYFLLGLVACELALQWRSHLRWGQSIFDVAAQGETRYVRDTKTGLKLLRPNHLYSSQNQSIRSNSMGLRSAELKVPKAPDSLRIAVIGASSVFGAYAADNNLTFSSLLEQNLTKAYPGRLVEVLNAGVVGLSLIEQVTLLRKLVLPTKPDLIVLYSGTNDFANYCRISKKASPSLREPLWQPNLAAGLLSLKLITKNTAPLRKEFAGPEADIDPDSVDLGDMANNLRDFITAARASGVPVLVATNARSFRREQPISVQRTLAATALYYNQCFSLDGLHRMHDRVNAAILAVAQEQQARTIAIDKLMPGGAAYFVDANHFSAKGERTMADILSIRIARDLPAASRPEIMAKRN